MSRREFADYLEMIAIQQDLETERVIFLFQDDEAE